MDFAEKCVLESLKNQRDSEPDAGAGNISKRKKTFGRHSECIEKRISRSSKDPMSTDM